MNSSEIQIGKFEVVTTQGHGHPPEFYADRMLSRLLYISDNLPEPIRQQAMAYQQQVHAILLAGIHQAIKSDRSTVIGALRKAGLNEAATFVHNMEK